MKNMKSFWVALAAFSLFLWHAGHALEVTRISQPRAHISASAIPDAALRTLVYGGIKKAGFTYVTLDLKGYRTGSMNQQIQTSEEHGEKG